MQRTLREFPLPASLLERLTYAAAQFPVAMVLNSNGGKNLPGDPYGEYDFLAGFGAASQFRNEPRAFAGLQNLLDKYNDWIFCAFSYDLKNELENLRSKNPDGIGFPSCHFFQPQHVISVQRGANCMVVHSLAGEDPAGLLEALEQPLPGPGPAPGVQLQARTSKDDYMLRAQEIHRHLQRGDIYELNYCLEFFAEKATIDPARTWLALNALSPMPFSCYYCTDDFYLLCASPERFLKKKGTKVIAQPMKGTARRGSNGKEDAEHRLQLQENEKERSENIMITDLVRNDLSHTARRGSVAVAELMGVYTFPALHQAITTVTSEVNAGTSVADIIRSAFPMGSMTGAPKVRAMELIEEFESVRRGLFSGSVGYITPGGDFDLNVVIRSILYRENQYLSFQAGSAITIRSDADAEYGECLLKASSMMKALGND